MLRKLRIGVAVVVFTLITLLFLDFTGTLHAWFGWLARVQLIPAILAANFAIIAGIIFLTLLFGRIYCSTLCPLGVMQDGISWLSGRRKGKKLRFRHSRSLKWLRVGLGVIFIVALLVHALAPVVSLLDPYAAFGRIATSFFAPVWRLGNNLLATIAERADSYAVYPVEVFVKSWTVFGVAAVWLAGLAVLAWWKGRIYCNSVCPVGTILGGFSSNAVFAPTIDNSKCTGCGLCERACKSECIDSQKRDIDLTRCVVCFDCIDSCKLGAMKYSPSGLRMRPKRSASADIAMPNGDAVDKKGISRRTFLSIAAAFTVANTVKAQQLQVEGGLADIEEKKRPDRKTPILPPGARDSHNMQRNCVACQLCVSACPNHTLVPSSRLSTVMQPEMSYERGYCRPECVECGSVCPTGAIEKITPADKAAISIGNAVWVEANCVVNRDEVPCTECQRHCPTGAVVLVAREPENPDSLKIPAIDTSLCIGCGACEHLCPARPFPAIYVEGHVSHHEM
jgi:formate hydrogenlyase subunit 6/NADH:ubiquinone oxidoreductase subunit I